MDIRRHGMISIVAIGIAVMGASGATGQTVRYVDGDAALGGDGLNWNTAYRFLQDALADASGPTEIRVAQGTYLPDHDETNPDGLNSDCCEANGGLGCDDSDCQALVCSVLGYCCAIGWDDSCAKAAANLCGDVCSAREATFQLINGATLSGGYAGAGEANPDDRDVGLYETILSGDLAANDGPGAFENNDENAYSIVTGSGTDSTAVLDGFTITAGNANGPDPGELPWVRGGGMWNLTGSPTITSCTFLANFALRFGGGMYNALESSPTITDCTFTGNVADNGPTSGSGGAMYNFPESNPTISHCTFSDNVANGTGGGIRNQESSPTVTGCTFSENSAGAGGGMGNLDLSNPKITSCEFLDNMTTGIGGAMINSSSSPAVINCLFADNSAGDKGGAVYSALDSRPTFTNCTIAYNTTALAGGGLYTTDSFGGHSEPALVNCILYGNNDVQIMDDSGAVTSAKYSDVEGGFTGTGNIDQDPSFVDSATGDYRLLTGSPCIDAGHNWAIAGLADTDLDDNPRFADDPATTDTGCGLPVIVDMGAYEFEGDPFPVKLGDIDGDGTVGIVDFLALLGDWGSCVEQCCLADLDLDDDVGITDFLLLLANWG